MCINRQCVDKMTLIESIIDQFGPILAAHGDHVVTMNGNEFLLWKISGGTYTVEASLPGDVGSQFRADIICLARNAESKLFKYLKCNNCHNETDCK